jgi:outer membrane protein TolC
MTLSRRWLILLLACCGCVSEARAQDSSGAPHRGRDDRAPTSERARVGYERAPASEVALGLEEALTLALRRDARVAVAHARRRASEARRDEAMVGYAPDLLVGAAYTDGFPGSGGNLGLRGMLGSPFFRHYVAGVDASFHLVELLRMPFVVRAAEAGINAHDAASETARREVALTLIELFERAMEAAERSAVIDAELGARRQQIEALRARAQAGMVAGEQLLQAEAGVADAEAELAAARSEEQSARAALRALLGDDRALTATLHMEIPAVTTELPEVRMARAWRRQASDFATLRDMEWIPRLSVGGSLGYANPPRGADTGYYAFGAAVAFPLTGAFREQNRRSAAIAEAEARAHEAEFVVQQLAVRVAEMDGAIAGLEAALPSAERSVTVARSAVDAMNVRAQAGTVPVVEVEAARAVLRRAQTRLRMLTLRIDGLRARRTFLTSARSA